MLEASLEVFLFLLTPMGCHWHFAQIFGQDGLGAHVDNPSTDDAGRITNLQSMNQNLATVLIAVVVKQTFH